MALLEIRKFPDPVLRKVSEPVEKFDEELRALCQDMAETMYDEPGIGLAAPQVGVSLRLFIGDGTIFGFELGTTVVFANPTVLSSEGEQEGEEGCLSFPGVFEKISRPEKCRVRARCAARNVISTICGLSCRRRSAGATPIAANGAR